MKTNKIIIGTALVLTILGAQNTFACSVEVNGIGVKPTILKQNSATLVNEDGQKSVAITCEPFEGTIDGIDRLVRLKVGSCTVVSNQGSLFVYECAK